MSQGIYRITNLINDKFYIGQSVNIESRWKDHIRISKKKGRQFEYPLYRAFRKYGTDNFKFEILELVPNKKDLTKKEIQYYEKLKPKYNQKHPEELVIKGKKVYKIDIETLKILNTYESVRLASRKNNIAQASIINVCRGKKITTGGFYWAYDEDYDENWKPKERDPRFVQKKVFQFDLDNNFIKEYESLSESSRQTLVNAASISLCCRGKFKQSGGYIWRYEK